MAIPTLDALKAALLADPTVAALVDDQIDLFQQIYDLEPLLRDAPYKSLISCELTDVAGPKNATDPVFQVVIYSRNGDDNGAAYCAEIADAVKTALASGWSGVAVEGMRGKVVFSSEAVGHKCVMVIRAHIKATYTITLAASATSPEEYGGEIVFVATVSPDEAIQYRFLMSGPGTGSAWRDMSGWQSRNSFSWRPGAKDVGTSSIKVQVRAGTQIAGQMDQESSSLSFVIEAPAGAGGSNTAPTITSLVPSAASPQEEGERLFMICLAADVDSDRLYYRFYLTGPGTGSAKMLVQDWGRKNAWAWTPSEADIGSNTIEAQIRDGNHAEEGSYDDSETLTFTITAQGESSNSAPTITSLTPTLSSPRGIATALEFICIAADADDDRLYYRFFLTGPGTASKKKLVQNWSAKNSWAWTPGVLDIGANTIEVQVRDGNHADEGSYDDSETCSFTVSSNTAPAIAEIGGVYINEAGLDVFPGDILYAVCDASDTDGDQVLYKWWLYRDSIGAAREELTGWGTQNWVKYVVNKMDYGTILLYCQVRDGNHAGEESYDDEDSVIIDVYRASLESVTPSLASPQANENTIVFTAVASKTTEIFYRFWLKGPGTGSVWRDMTGWTEKNSWSWRTLACDVGTNYVRCEVTDQKENWDDDDTTDRRIDTTYTIS